MALARRQPYHELFGHISEQDAQAEPEIDRLFIEPAAGAYPRITIRTTVEVEGLSLDITLNDMSISDAVALLRRRGCTPAARQARQAPRQAASWVDLDTEPSEAGALVIGLAQRLMDDKTSWSTALAVASRTVKENLR